jgi:hypothetical protein
MFSVQVNLDASECTPKYHCPHDGGRYAIRLTTGEAASAVYVSGTPAELTELAARLAGVVAGLAVRS